jgi:catechol 2,3-dioxygenase-like lactoylglutathione lyase family enzyme
MTPAILLLVLALDGSASVASIGMTVSDLDRSVSFFTRVLDFEKVSEGEAAGTELERLTGVFGSRVRTARLRLGDEFLDLTEYLAPRGLPAPADQRSNDRWFQHAAIIVSDMDRAYSRLREHRVEHASPGPQTLPAWNEKVAGIRAFYFRDPDGHALEVLMFPPGKGNPKWQNSQGRLFLGIDHTAIVTSNTRASLRFYCDLLGLHVAGEGENYGIEQERLNNVFGARLRITVLRGANGPGIELLEYLSPTNGRRYPDSARANDLIHWQVRLSGIRPSQAESQLRDARVLFISPEVVELPSTTFGIRQSILVRDPDGHAVEIADP